MKNRKNISLIIYLVVLAVALTWMSGIFSQAGNTVPYSQVISLFQKEQVKSFTVQGDVLTLRLHSPYNGDSTVSTSLADPEGFREDMKDLFQSQADSGILVSYDFIAAEDGSAYDLVLPLLIVGLVLLFVWAMMMGRMNNANPLQNFGKARTVLGIPDSQKVTFDDVAGADEEKAELQEVVDFLRNPEKFTAIGARIPHGMLLVGPPGTGKTLLARAVAGEAGVQFLSISGSDFVEMYVGVGASRVRDLFDQAKKVAPAIIFIDEIDAVGRKRGSGLGGGHDEKEQTLNQLLVEMDGFAKNEGVIVLAATNRPDILDPALLRPGRFDRQIYVSAPDSKGREEILKVHAKNKRLDATVNLKTVAMATSGFTGADLSNLLNEAAILAARQNRPVLNMNDLNEAMMKIMVGPEKKSRVALKRDLRATAIHEAGHAIAMYHLPTHDPVRQISIVPRGQALGITWSQPMEDSTHLAKDMVARYGMCERLGTVSYLSGGEVFIGRDYQQTKSYSEAVAGTIDEEVKNLIDRAYDQCMTILKENEAKLQEVVNYLMEYENMSGEQFAACMEGKEIGDNSATALFDAFEEVPAVPAEAEAQEDDASCEE